MPKSKTKAIIKKTETAYEVKVFNSHWQTGEWIPAPSYDHTLETEKLAVLYTKALGADITEFVAV